jgi:Fe-S cluster assembly iron-binding protein IscA
LALDELKDDDIQVEEGEFKFVLEDLLTENFGSFTVDFSDNWLRRGFSILPNGMEKASNC